MTLRVAAIAGSILVSAAAIQQGDKWTAVGFAVAAIIVTWLHILEQR